MIKRITINEKNISTKQPQTQAHSRFSCTHGN